jgi:hypothetical protein
MCEPITPLHVLGATVFQRNVCPQNRVTSQRSSSGGICNGRIEPYPQLVYVARGMFHLTPCPSPARRGVLRSPFPCREGGWGVRLVVNEPHPLSPLLQGEGSSAPPSLAGKGDEGLG